MLSSLKNNLTAFVLSLCLFLISFSFFYFNIDSLIEQNIQKNSFTDSYIPTYDAKLKKEIVFIFVASSSCFACNVSYLPQSITLIKIKL